MSDFFWPKDCICSLYCLLLRQEIVQLSVEYFVLVQGPFSTQFDLQATQVFVQRNVHFLVCFPETEEDFDGLCLKTNYLYSREGK